MPSAPATRPPPRGTVLLRCIEPGTADTAQLAAWTAMLDAGEQARAARFRAEPDRRAFIAAHALVRAMLAEAGGLPPAAWRFTTGPAGRPEIEAAQNPAGLRFSLSHTRGLAACALAARDDVGLDVEALDRQLSVLELAERYFAPEEAALLAALPAPQRLPDFLRLWTLKEALAKATGEGFGLGFARFAFTLDPPSLLYAPSTCGDPCAWRFLQCQPTPGHLLAVALRRAG